MTDTESIGAVVIGLGALLGLVGGGLAIVKVLLAGIDKRLNLKDELYRERHDSVMRRLEECEGSVKGLNVKVDTLIDDLRRGGDLKVFRGNG